MQHSCYLEKDERKVVGKKHFESSLYVHPKSNWKTVNKKRMATARRLIFLEFLKASIADLITLLFSSLQNSVGGGDSDSGNSFADPCQFLPFPNKKI